MFKNDRPDGQVKVKRDDGLPPPPSQHNLQNGRGENGLSLQLLQRWRQMVSNPSSGISSCRSIWTVEHMRNFFIVGLTERAFGMGLMFSVKKLVPHSNATSRKFPLPALKPKREPVDGFGT